MKYKELRHNKAPFTSESYRFYRIIPEYCCEIYFVGKDVAEALGYVNTAKAISTHCRNSFKTVINVASQNGMSDSRARMTQEMKVIPEGDVYRLAAKSKLSGAERFESWVFDEVLPTISKTGGYIPVSKDESEFPKLQNFAVFLRRISELQKKVTSSVPHLTIICTVKSVLPTF